MRILITVLEDGMIEMDVVNSITTMLPTECLRPVKVPIPSSHISPYFPVTEVKTIFRLSYRGACMPPNSALLLTTHQEREM